MPNLLTCSAIEKTNDNHLQRSRFNSQ